MKSIIKLICLISVPFIVYACKPITAYPLKTGTVEFDWGATTALTAKVIVLDRYPNEPPIYGRTSVFSRESDTVSVTIQSYEYRGNCTLEPYENPESYQYASIKNSVNVSQGNQKIVQLWDVNPTN